VSVSLAVNATAVTGITTSYALAKKILLTTLSTETGTQPVIPQSGYMSSLELELVETGGVSLPTSVSAFLAWDAAGDHIFTAAATANVVAAMTTARTFGVGIAIDKWYRAPVSQTAAGTVYLFIKVDAGTVTVPANGARLTVAPDFARGS
jgi:hypothetical protein